MITRQAIQMAADAASARRYCANGYCMSRQQATSPVEGTTR
jgi:hypothetical protein